MNDMLSLVRKGETGIIALGNHPAIFQSILDFDFLSGKAEPSLLAIVTGGRKAQKFFFGGAEVLVPCFADVSSVPRAIAAEARWMLNVQSGRRAFESTVSFFESFPGALGGTIFAENVPEKHATELIRMFSGKKFITGPASVGFLVPGALKLGAIGGVDPLQIQAGNLTAPGAVAVGSTSGGMTNELIRAVAGAGKRLSFAAAVGGDRFPVVSLTELFTLAEKDKATKALVYFGELGGQDEYEIVEMIRSKRFTKPLVAYIAGVIDEAFDDHVQFGHAKALVRQNDESARAKRQALRKAGAAVPDTFPGFLAELAKLPGGKGGAATPDIAPLLSRRASILSTREVREEGSQRKQTFTGAILETLLDRPLRSLETAAFADTVFALLIDHGGNVSGAVNTMIAARAGKDLVSSLSSGLLTIGPRFGGAVNDAAKTWLAGVSEKKDVAALLEEKAKAGERIPGIGHKKYRVGIPDPRVAELSRFALGLKKHPHYDFARAVEQATTRKSGSLILNIDGAIAAILLDVLAEREKLSDAELKELADAEFFNAFFVIPRSVGFIAHFMEQKRNDEGLFRLPDDLLFVRRKKKGK